MLMWTDAGQLGACQQEAARKAAGVDTSPGRGRQRGGDGSQGACAAVEPRTERRRDDGHHGSGARCTYQDSRLQLLASLLTGSKQLPLFCDILCRLTTSLENLEMSGILSLSGKCRVFQ